MNVTKIKKDIFEENWARFRVDLATAIIKRKISYNQIQRLYTILRETELGSFYADNASQYRLKLQADEWNKEYLDELFIAFVNGYTNETIALHMWKVANKIKWKDVGYIVKVCIASASAIAGSVVALNVIF